MNTIEPPSEESVRIPTRPVDVELQIVGGRKESVIIYLDTVSERHAGPETVAEALNRDRAFLPFRSKESDETFLVRRGAIRIVFDNHDPSKTLSHENAPGFVDLVTLQLDTGETIEGTLATVLPPDRSRLSDFFNLTQDQFIAVEVADGVSYVNRDFISVVCL